MLEVKNVTKTFKLNNGNSISVLNNINLTLYDKGIVFILGKSGCGKTTLLSILEGILEPSEGKVFFNNKEVYKNNETINTFGILFQAINLIEGITVYENLLTTCEIKNIDKSNIDYYLEKFKLLNLKDQKVENLSGGEKQRVAFVRAILNKPNVLFCDEPTGALDHDNSLILMNLLRDFAKEGLVIIVTHNESLIDFNNDSVITLKNGKIVKINNKTFQEQIKNTNIHKNKKKRNIRNILSNRLLKVHKLKNVLFFVSFSLSLFFIGLTLSLYFGINNLEQSLNFSYLNSNKFEISEITNESSNTGITITKLSRPNYSNLRSNLYDFIDLKIDYNLDYFLNCTIKTIDNKKLDNVLIETYYDENKKDIIVNSTFENYYLKKFNKSSIYSELFFNFNTTYIYKNFINDVYKEVNEDFILAKKVYITEIINEFTYLAQPTIYFPYELLKEEVSIQKTEKINREFIQNYTWLDILRLANSDDDITSYSFNVFTTNDYDTSKMYSLSKSLKDSNLNIENNGQTITSSFLEIANILTFGLLVFSILSFLTTISLTIFIIMSIFISERKVVAILKIQGLKKNDLYGIFSSLFLKIIGLSILISLLVTLISSYLLNLILGLNLNVTKMFLYLFIDKGVLTIVYLGIILIIILIMYLLIYFVLMKTDKIDLALELKEE